MVKHRAKVNFQKMLFPDSYIGACICKCHGLHRLQGTKKKTNYKNLVSPKCLCGHETWFDFMRTPLRNRRSDCGHLGLISNLIFLGMCMGAIVNKSCV